MKQAAGMPLMGLSDEGFRPRLSAKRKRELDEHEWNEMVRYINETPFSRIVPGSVQYLFDMHGRCTGLIFRRVRDAK